MKILDYLINHYDDVLASLAVHAEISLIAICISVLIGFPIGVLISKKKKLSGPVNAVCNTIFSIPSLALFAFLVPITGLGGTTAIVALVLYNQYILVKNISMGFDEIAPEVIEAGRAMGYTDWKLFFDIELPLATPMIINGIKLAFIGTVAGTTLAATIGAGGLGELILIGQSMHHWHKVVIGAVLASALAFLISVVFQGIEDRTRRKAQGYSGKGRN